MGYMRFDVLVSRHQVHQVTFQVRDNNFITKREKIVIGQDFDFSRIKRHEELKVFLFFLSQIRCREYRGNRVEADFSFHYGRLRRCKNSKCPWTVQKSCQTYGLIVSRWMKKNSQGKLLSFINFTINCIKLPSTKKKKEFHCFSFPTRHFGSLATLRETKKRKSWF